MTRAPIVNVTALDAITAQLVAVNISSATPNYLLATDALNNIVSVPVPTVGDVNPTADTLSKRDPDANLFANNFIPSTTVVATSGTTTTLNVGSGQIILFTGTLNQNVKMPKANDFPAAGGVYEFNNNSTGTISLQNFGSGSIGTIPTGGFAKLVLTSNASANGVWDIHPYIPHGTIWGTSDLSTTTTFTTTNTLNSTSPSTGSMHTAGGVGIEKDLWVGGNLNVDGTLTATSLGLTKVTLWHDQDTTLTGTPIAIIASLNVYGITVWQNPPAVNDSFEQSFRLDPGSYTLYVLGTSGVNRGNIQWYIDGVAQGTPNDWYSLSATPVIKSTAITVVGTAMHTLKGIVSSKNLSSSSYFALITKYWIK